ncbi:MAG: HAD-IC family P-type ATPase [Thermoleophilia bacterium]|nr:HAD-IC family P-type ATPase [Thermoleophilia bacterium]
MLALAASVERESEHPLAEAITHAAVARDLPLEPVHDFEALPGMGARAGLNGSTYYLGNTRLFTELAITLGDAILTEVGHRQDQGETVVLLGTADGALGAIGIADTIRPQSRDAVRDLKAAGVERVLMLTGDNRQTAAAVAAGVGLDDYHAELLPNHKVDVVKELLAKHGRVAMVGDGINDAPALATATVGIAMGAAGTDTALETADIALMADDLSKVPFTIRLSRAARATVRQNIGFALGLKILTTLLVFPGWLTLWMAVLADTGGSLIVIANGLRLLRHGRGTTAGGGAGGAAVASAAAVADGAPGGESMTAADGGLPARPRHLNPEVTPTAACGKEGCACSLADHEADGHEGRDRAGAGVRG